MFNSPFYSMARLLDVSHQSQRDALNNFEFYESKKNDMRMRSINTSVSMDNRQSHSKTTRTTASFGRKLTAQTMRTASLKEATCVENYEVDESDALAELQQANAAFDECENSQPALQKQA